MKVKIPQIYDYPVSQIHVHLSSLLCSHCGTKYLPFSAEFIFSMQQMLWLVFEFTWTQSLACAELISSLLKHVHVQLSISCTVSHDIFEVGNLFVSPAVIPCDGVCVGKSQKQFDALSAFTLLSSDIVFHSEQQSKYLIYECQNNFG